MEYLYKRSPAGCLWAFHSNSPYELASTAYSFFCFVNEEKVCFKDAFGIGCSINERLETSIYNFSLGDVEFLRSEGKFSVVQIAPWMLLGFFESKTLRESKKKFLDNPHKVFCDGFLKNFLKMNSSS